MRVTIDKELHAALGGAQMEEAVEQKTLVPSKETAFKIKSIDGSIVRNKEGEPEQILNVETSGEISTIELAKALHIYLLPKREPEKTEASTEEESSTENASEETSTEPNENTEKETAKSAEEESGSDEDGENTEDKSGERKWANAEEITDEILERATVVIFTPIPTEKEHSRDHHFKFKLEGDGLLYVRIDKGLRARSGYDLAENFTNVL